MTVIRALLAVAVIAVAAYGVFEVRFWSSKLGQSMISGRQRRIRGIGLILLFFGLCFWFRGTFIPIPHPTPGIRHRSDREQALNYIGYWTFTFCLMLPLIPLAILDTRENLRKAAEERKQLMQESFKLQAELDHAIEQDQNAIQRDEQAD